MRLEDIRKRESERDKNGNEEQRHRRLDNMRKREIERVKIENKE